MIQKSAKYIRQQIDIMINCMNVFRETADDILEYLKLNDVNTDAYLDTLEDIADGEITESETAMTELKDILADESDIELLDDDDGEKAVSFKTIGPSNMEIRTPVDGNTFVAWIGASDYNSKNCGIVYETPDTEFDLAMAEVKKDSLAIVHSLKPDNKDIDLYVWGDINTEDFTGYIRIPYEATMFSD